MDQGVSPEFPKHLSVPTRYTAGGAGPYYVAIVAGASTVRVNIKPWLTVYYLCPLWLKGESLHS
jgi:hypothetical protein